MGRWPVPEFGGARFSLHPGFSRHPILYFRLRGQRAGLDLMRMQLTQLLVGSDPAPGLTTFFRPTVSEDRNPHVEKKAVCPQPLAIINSAYH